MGSAQINDGSILNVDVNAAAAIAGSKLQALNVGANAGIIPSTGVENAHVKAAAGIEGSKVQALSKGANAGVIPSTGVADAHVSDTAAIAFAKLAGVAAKGANSDITSLTGLTTPLSYPQGGRGTGAGALTQFPMPIFNIKEVVGSQLNSNTTLWLGLVNIPHPMTVNKLTVYISSTTGDGTLDISLYSEDGQTRLFSITTANLTSADFLESTAVAGVVIPAGNYWIAVNTNGTADLVTFFYTVPTQTPYGTTAGIFFDVAGEPVVMGTLAITAGTPPATIDPTAITEGAGKILLFRLDN